MKVVLSGTHDWILYLVMFALSAAAHTAAVFLMFAVEPPSVGPSGLDAPGLTGEPLATGSAAVAEVLSTWKSRLMGREEELKGELDAKIRRIDENPAPDADPAWTRENTPKKLEYSASLVGTNVRAVELPKSAAGAGRLDVRVELQSEPASVLGDVALVTRLVGLATQKRGFQTDKLRIDVYGSDDKLAGSFELDTQASRDLAAGRMTLRELFEEGLRSG